MAMKVRGITIELSIDSSGLEKALKDINKSLLQTQKDLKDVNKALELDPENVDLIEQKQRLLAKAIEDTKKKVDALKKAQEDLGDIDTEDEQRQFDALTREISGTEKKLESLNEEQERFTENAKNTQQGATAFEQSLSKIGAVADKVAKSTAAISAAALGALTGLAGMVYSAGQAADRWSELSQETGLSVETIQKMEYAAEQIDVPMESIVDAVKNMKGHLDENEGIMHRLGVETRTQSGEYRDIEGIFNDCVTALGDIENETERDTMAMDLFGSSADNLAGLIDDGGQSLRQLGNEAESIGVIIPEENVRALNEFNTSLEKMAAQLKGSAAAAAVPVLAAMEPVVEAVSQGIQGLASVLGNLNPKFIQIATVILAVVAAISPLAKMISGASTAIQLFTKLLPAAIVGLQALQGAFMSFFSNPYAAMIVAIVAALALLAAGIYAVVENWDTIGPAAEEALGSVKEGISDAISAVGSFASSIGSGVSGMFSGAVEGVTEFVSKLGELSGFSNIVEGIGNAFGSIADAIGDALGEVASIFQELVTKARTAGANTINAFTAGVKSVIAQVKAAFESLAAAIQGVWDSIKGRAKTAGSDTAKAYADGMKNGPRATIQAPLTSYGGGGGGGGNLNSPGLLNSAPELLGAINTLNGNIERLGAGGSNVNVELVGSAKDIFSTVRVQNAKLQTATGYHALA